MNAIFWLLLLPLAVTQTTYRYTYTALPVSTQMRPSYSMGYLSTNDNISISVDVPSPTGLSPYYFNIQIMTPANEPINPKTFFIVSAPAEVFWTVRQPSNYRVEVTTNDPFVSMVMFYLIIKRNGAPIEKIVDVLRTDVFKYIYLSQPRNNLTVTANYGAAYVSPMSPNNQFLFNGTLPSYPTYPSGTAIYEFKNIPAGYYGISFVTTTLSGAAMVTYVSEVYPCPFFSDFKDVHSIFQGCAHENIQGNSILPCINKDTSTDKCLGCLKGYKLANGVCLVDNSCGQRQFTHFGVCYDVSPQCDVFEPFTGACINCIRNNFIVVNGQCVPADNPTQTKCPEGKHFYKSYCISDSCAKAQINDFCTECANHSYQLNPNGTCTAIKCGLGYYYSYDRKQCVLVPYQCSNFSIAIQTCIACYPGYFLNMYDKTCVQPSGSKNCQVWDFTQNRCSMCDGGYVWDLNKCMLSSASTGPCESWQAMVKDMCINLPPHCVSLNNFYQCDKCKSGYSLNGGSCKLCNGPNPSSPCSCPTHQIMNSYGNCIKKNDHCLYVNQDTGSCLSCISGNAPVDGLCCPSGQSIQGGVCVTPSGEVRLSPSANFALYYKNCDWYVPAQMICKRCAEGFTMVYDDHCA